MKSDRRGATAVEFAIVAPILFLLVLGMIEFGRATMVQALLNQSAAEGCRVGIMEGATATDVQGRVRAYLPTINASKVTIAVSPANPAAMETADEKLTVTVTVAYKDVGWLPVPQWLGGKTLTGSASMAAERINRRRF